MTPATLLTPHFTLEELTQSATAARLGIDQTPPADVLRHLFSLASALEQVRTLLSYPIHITSGYRSPRLNAQLGGVADSAHLVGFAADFVCPQYGSPLAVADAIARSSIAFDQLIFERRWVHFSVALALRREVLTATFNAQGRASYIPGLHA